jgi:hypothetical protein
MNRIQLFLLLLVQLMTLSCLGAGDPGVETLRFLPGECLNSYELSYIEPSSEWHQCHSECFIFAFQMDLNDHKSVLNPNDQRPLGVPWFDMPIRELYKQFGENDERVKLAYEESFSVLRNYWTENVGSDWGGFDFTTLLYADGLSLKADKAFGRHQAGENLAPYLVQYPGNRFLDIANASFSPGQNLKEVMGYPLHIPLDYVCLLGTTISFSIPVGDCELTKEPVTFHIEIPVRNVKYLTWLNDRISNPSAPVPYEDGVLTCTFTTQYGLK